MRTLFITLLVFSIFTGFAEARTRAELVGLVRNRARTPISYTDFQLWIKDVNTENKRCRFVLRNVTQANLLDKLNDALSNSC